MRANTRQVLVGMFREPDNAREAIEALKDAGFPADDISILMSDRSQTRTAAEDTGAKPGAGTATGAVGGGVLGGLAGFLVGISALVIPGIGPIVGAGVLASTLAGAAIGGTVGALAGALTEQGVPEDEAKWYEGEVRGGRTLVTVRVGGRDEEAQTIPRRYGAYDVDTSDAGTTPYRATGGTTGTVR